MRLANALCWVIPLLLHYLIVALVAFSLSENAKICILFLLLLSWHCNLALRRLAQANAISSVRFRHSYGSRVTKVYYI